MSAQTQTNAQDHLAEASRALTESSLIQEWSEGERLILATRAQAEATIALAYEQRTANLIALFADSGHNGPAEGISYDQLVKTIRERLGL